MAKAKASAVASRKTNGRKAPKEKTTGEPTAKAPAGKTAKSSARRRAGRAKLTELMRGIDLCMMTTVGSDGALHARPMSNNGEVEFDGDAWFFSSKSTKTEELRDDDRVNLSYVGGTKKAPLWISLSGRARIVTAVAKKKELWQKELDRWFDNGPEDPKVVLIQVRAERASWWSYEDEGSVELT